MTDDKRASDAASESCHKCDRRFPDVSMINDGDDSLGPPVCCDCYDPNYKAPRSSEASVPRCEECNIEGGPKGELLCSLHVPFRGSLALLRPKGVSPSSNRP